VHAATVRDPAQPCVELRDGVVERGVEVPGTRLGTHDRPAGRTGYLDPLAVVGLARIALVGQLDVDSNQLFVVPFDLAQFLGDMLPVMLRDLNVAALDQDVHR
jgi:hypothetical protein